MKMKLIPSLFMNIKKINIQLNTKAIEKHLLYI